MRRWFRVIRRKNSDMIPSLWRDFTLDFGGALADDSPFITLTLSSSMDVSSTCMPSLDSKLYIRTYCISWCLKYAWHTFEYYHNNISARKVPINVSLLNPWYHSSFTILSTVTTSESPLDNRKPVAYNSSVQSKLRRKLCLEPDLECLPNQTPVPSTFWIRDFIFSIVSAPLTRTRIIKIFPVAFMDPVIQPNLKGASKRIGSWSSTVDSLWML